MPEGSLVSTPGVERPGGATDVSESDHSGLQRGALGAESRTVRAVSRTNSDPRGSPTTTLSGHQIEVEAQLVLIRDVLA